MLTVNLIQILLIKKKKNHIPLSYQIINTFHCIDLFCLEVERKVGPIGLSAIPLVGYRPRGPRLFGPDQSIHKGHICNFYHLANFITHQKKKTLPPFFLVPSSSASLSLSLSLSAKKNHFIVHNCHSPISLSLSLSTLLCFNNVDGYAENQRHRR